MNKYFIEYKECICYISLAGMCAVQYIHDDGAMYLTTSYRVFDWGNNWNA